MSPATGVRASWGGARSGQFPEALCCVHRILISGIKLLSVNEADTEKLCLITIPALSSWWCYFGKEGMYSAVLYIRVPGIVPNLCTDIHPPDTLRHSPLTQHVHTPSLLRPTPSHCTHTHTLTHVHTLTRTHSHKTAPRSLRDSVKIYHT